MLLHPAEVDGKWEGHGYTDPAPMTVSTGKAENKITPDKVRKGEVLKSLDMVAWRWTEVNARRGIGCVGTLRPSLKTRAQSQR